MRYVEQQSLLYSDEETCINVNVKSAELTASLLSHGIYVCRVAVPGTDNLCTASKSFPHKQ